MRLGALVANSAVAAAYSPEHARLTRIRDLGAAQEALLLHLVRRNAGSEFGRAHGFARIGSVRDYRRAVPLATWDDIAPATQRIARGETGVLTTEPVRLLEPSSGSTSATKLVPYTASLRAEFQRGIAAWLYDLYAAQPALLAGRSYWSITPVSARRSHDSAVPIGFDEDADYLGPVAKRLVSHSFAVSATVAQRADLDDFLDTTCRQLLAAADLALVSVWNPTLLTILLERIRDRLDTLLSTVGAGRRAVLRAAVPADDWAAVWPRLRLVSCWADAAAAAPARSLAKRLPHTTIQPKGLLATEGFVSLPLVAAGGAVLAARSHVVEFLPEGGADDDCRLGHEVEAGRRYAVVLTTGGGLYRYRLGDLVTVTGHHGRLPVLRLVGRVDRVSDLVGEKLNEAFVGDVLARLGLAGCALVATTDHYRLVGRPAVTPDLLERLDTALRAAFHYDHARRLGQLRPPAAYRGTGDPRDLLSRDHGTGRLGDVKPTALVPPMTGPVADPDRPAAT